jgi:hypothetical protein
VNLTGSIRLLRVGDLRVTPQAKALLSMSPPAGLSIMTNGSMLPRWSLARYRFDARRMGRGVVGTPYLLVAGLQPSWVYEVFSAVAPPLKALAIHTILCAPDPDAMAESARAVLAAVALIRNAPSVRVTMGGKDVTDDLLVQTFRAAYGSTTTQIPKGASATLANAPSNQVLERALLDIARPYLDPKYVHPTGIETHAQSWRDRYPMHVPPPWQPVRSPRRQKPSAPQDRVETTDEVL